MGSPRVRRAETAERAFVSLLVLFLAGAPAAADPDADPGPADPVHEVGAVLATATRGERNELEVAGNTTVLEREAIERSGARDLPDLLSRQPGLFVTRSTTNPAGVQVEARGFNNGGSLGSSLLVMIDGRRVNEADTGNTDWALLPLDLVESIEIVLGPTSSLYGDNAVGGVVHIRTLPEEGPLRGTLRGSGGRYSRAGGSLWAMGSQGPITAGFFGSGLTEDGYRDRSAFDATDMRVSIESALGERFRIGLQGGRHEDLREFPGALDPDELADLGRRAADPDSSADEAEIESFFVQSWFEAHPFANTQARLQPFHRERWDDVTITSMVFGTTTIETDKASTGFDSNIRLDEPVFGRPNRFLVGFEFLHEETDRIVASAFGTNISDNTRDVVSGYVQEELSPWEGVWLSAGVRLDGADYDLRVDDPGSGDSARAQPDFLEASPRVALSYQPCDGWSTYASYARGLRLPNFDEDAPLLPFPPGGEPSLPGLDPQRSDAFEIGLKRRGERVSASLSLYYMLVENEILFDPFTFSNTNLDEVHHRGIEAALQAQLLSWLWGHASYTLDDVRIEDADGSPATGRRMPITPLHRGSFGLTARLPHDLEIGANLNVVDQRVLSNDFDHQLATLDPYALLDLLFAWRPQLGEHAEGALSFALRNVGGEAYEGFGARFDVFDPMTMTSNPTRFLNPAATRTWEVGLAVTLRR